MKKFKKNISAFMFFLLDTAVLSAILFVLKELAIKQYMSSSPLNNPVFKIDYVMNTGAAFGLLNQQSAFLCGIAAFVLCSIIYYIFKKGKKINYFERFTYALIFAGILSNTFERLKTGAVLDYINLNFVNFPVFNSADIFICIGAILLVFILIFKR